MKTEYVDPENYGHSFVKQNNFNDAYYHFVVDTLTINDLKRETRWDDVKLREIAKKYSSRDTTYSDLDFERCPMKDLFALKIDVMRFAYKSAKRMIYKKTVNEKGEVLKVSRRDEKFDPPENLSHLKASKVLDTWYEGNYVVGADEIYNYKECENLVRDEMNRVKAPFVARATNIYKNRLKSFLGDIQPICKQLQRQHLKIQQLVAELKPDLIKLDLDSLAELDAGKGANKKENWKVALSLLNVKGVVITERIDMGEMGMKEGAGASPIASSQGSALAPLLNTWAHYYNLIRDITGVNPARDGSLPADALLGVNQMAQLASNTATQHIVDASTDFNKKISELISSRLHAIFKFDEDGRLRRLYENAVGKHNVDALEALSNRHLHEFGFSVEMVPSQQEMEEFRTDLGIAMKEGTIEVEDKIKAQSIAKGNIKLAYEYLKYRRRKRIKQKINEQMMLDRNKSENDIRSAQAASESKIQAYGIEAQIDLDKEAKLSQIRLAEKQAVIQLEAPGKDTEFRQAVYIEQVKSLSAMNLNQYKEQAKDNRLDRQATHNSKMITQRQENQNPINFENEFDYDALFAS